MECTGGSGGGGLSRLFRYPCAAAPSKPHPLASAPFQSISASSLRPHLRFANNITVYFYGCRLPPAPPAPPSPAAVQRACGAQRVGFGQKQRGRHHVTRLVRGRGRGRGRGRKERVNLTCWPPRPAEARAHALRSPPPAQRLERMSSRRGGSRGKQAWAAA